MKLLILSALCGSVLSFSAVAQDIVKPIAPIAPKVSIGVQAQFVESLGNANTLSYEGNYRNVGLGFFLRYYLGNHFAIETGMMASLSHKIIDANSYYYYSPGNRKSTLRASSYEIPILFQYHLAKRTATMRPHFGVGFGYANRQYDVHEWQNTQHGAEFLRDYSYDEPTLFLQFAQGLTYQVNSKIQINQSFSYQREHAGRDNIGLRIGFGYTL